MKNFLILMHEDPPLGIALTEVMDMPYRIEYDGGVKKYGKKRWNLRLEWVAAFFLLFLVLVNTGWPEGRETLHKLLFPGDDGTVVQALELLAVELQEGIGPGQAVEAFCREIIAGGSY